MGAWGVLNALRGAGVEWERDLVQMLLGEPKLPQSACSYFYCLMGFLFLLTAQFTAFACETSQSGVKSKRIALVAVRQ
jgi:hypothetical protein